MKYIQKFALGLIAILITTPFVALADGMVVSEPYVYVQETSQQAVIFYEDATATETMVVSVGYEGTAESFAWLIPTPGQPTVQRGSQNLFTNLESITDPYSNDYSDVTGGDAGFGAAESVSQSVTVVDELMVDYYDVTILTATNAQDLVDWFNANGYKYPETAAYLLTDYINNGWYFTAMKINSAFSVSSSLGEALHSGDAVPVQLTFQTNNIVYPLRISSIVEEVTAAPVGPIDPFIEDSTDDASEPTANPTPAVGAVSLIDEDPYDYDNYQIVTVYVLADHRVESTHSQFYTNYANWVTADHIESWALDTNGNPWVQPQQDKYFLTKMTASLYSNEMTEDVFFQLAATDDVITQTTLYAWDSNDYIEFGVMAFIIACIVLVGMVITPFGIFHIIATIVRGVAKSRGWKITAHVMQWLNLFVLLCISALLWLISWEDGLGALSEWFNDYFYVEDAGGIVGVAAGEVLFICLLIISIVLQSIIMLVRRRRQIQRAHPSRPAKKSKTASKKK